MVAAFAGAMWVCDKVMNLFDFLLERLIKFLFRK